MPNDNKFYDCATGAVTDNPLAGTTFDQRQKMRAARDRADAMIRADIAERTAKAETHDQQVLRSHRERIATLKAQRASATQQERSMIDRRLAALKVEADKLEGKLTEEDRRARLGNDRLVQLAREQADILERSWRAIYPAADENDVMLAIELARSNEWDSPQACHTAFSEVAERISAKNLAAEMQKCQEATIVAQKAEADALKAQVRVAENEKALAQIRGSTDA